MRLLIGARPGVHVFEVIVLALECEGACLGPCPNHQIMRFGMAFERKGRIGAHREIFAPDAAHHPGDETSAGDAIDHRVFFGERLRMFAQPECIAENGNLGITGLCRQRRCHDDR